MSNHDIDMSNGRVRFSKGIIILVAGLMLLAILGILCKKCTSLSKFAEKDEYNLPKNDGLIKKTKELFVDLLAKEDTSIYKKTVYSVHSVYSVC
ncbi:hypothetical protein [Viscerimonas tarda]